MRPRRLRERTVLCQQTSDLIGRVSSKVNIEETDPGVRDLKSGDFTLSGASACRDTGSDLSHGAADHPVRLEPPNGHPRYQDQKIDIGPYEFVE